MKCNFYSEKDGKRVCKRWSDNNHECVFEPHNEDECYERNLPKMIEYGSSDAYEDKTRAAEEARRKSLIKLELVQYPYSKAGRPTVYLDDYQIAGPRAFGVGRTVASYELTKENLKDIQRIVMRALNRMNGIE